MNFPINVLAEILISLEITEIKNLIKNDRGWQDAFNFTIIHNMYMCAYSDSTINHDIYLSEEAYNYDFYPLEYKDTKSIEGTLYLNLEMLNQKYKWNNKIPRRFLENHKFKNIILEKGENITEINDCFLNKCPSLTEIDLRQLCNIILINRGFLIGCSGLTKINLEPLSNVTQIRGEFLCECTGLNQINLTPISNVTQIGGWFLCECSSLTKINLAPLSNITQIDDGFLWACSGLTQLNLSPLLSVTQIENNFLRGCSQLISVKLSKMNKKLFKKIPEEIEILIV